MYWFSMSWALVASLSLAQPPIPGVQDPAKEDAPPAQAEGASAEEGEISADAEDEVRVPFYGNETCPISGEEIDREAFVEERGKRVYACCKSCVRKVKKDFEAAYETAYPEEKIRDIENERCPIMGGKTEGRGATSEFQGHRIHYCCPGCDRKFMEAPNRHLTLLLDPDLEVLGNETCLVERDEKVAKDCFFIYRGVLIDASSPEAIERFREDPDGFLKRAGVDLASVKGRGN